MTMTVKTIDARGLQCPGPIMRLSQEISAISAGQALSIAVTDPAFAADVAAWCKSTGHQLVDMQHDAGVTRATIVRHTAESQRPIEQAGISPRKKTLVVFSSDFDRLVASFIIANGAAAMDSEVTMFFTFWGLNALRRPEKIAVEKTLIERMFGWMMPRGAERLTLSRMNMGGAGLRMIKGIMKRKNVPSLRELIASAQRQGVRLVACSMSMDLMGIKRQELIDGVEEGGVAMYLNQAEAGNVNLFI